MATGDMKARLLLDSKDFEKNIKKSKKQAEDFKVSGEKTGAAVAAAFTKITAVVATIKAAKGVFDTFISSSQTLSDSFSRSMEAAQGAADNFVYSLANADFSSFNGGLDAMLGRLKETYDAFDKLANTKMSAAFANAQDEAEFAEKMAIAKNKNLSFEVRSSALVDADKIVEKISKTATKVETDSFTALAKMFAAKSGVASSIFTEDIFKAAFRADVDDDSIRDTFIQDYESYQLQRRLAQNTIAKSKELYKEKYGHNYTWQVADAQQTKNFEALRDEAERLVAEDLARIDRENASVIANYVALERLKDEVLNSAMETFNSAVSTRRSAAERSAAVAEQERIINSEIEKQKAAIKKAAEEAAEAAAEAAALNAEMARLKTVQPLGGMAGIGLADTSKKLPGSIAMLDENPAARALNYWEGEYLKPFEEDAKRLEDINGVVGMLGSSFSQLGSSIGGAAGNMLTFVGGALDAAQAIIPLIAQIMAEQAAHKANANAALSDAAAKTVSAYAGIPFAGIALGVAGVAAIIGAMRNIPKFAEGGIVNSATLGVFGEAGPEAVMPLDKLEEYITPRELRVTGNIKASGKELVVVLDNYNRVRNG